MNTPSVLLLGGYGAVGRVVARLLLQETDAHVTLAGRSLARAEALAGILSKDFPDRVSAALVDVSQPATVTAACAGIQLVMVMTTTPQHAATVGRAALAAGCDYLDSFVSEGTYNDLLPLQEQLQRANRVFVTNAGFHPGLPAPFIRIAAPYFDQYQSARVAMAMNARFERADQAAEILPMLAQFSASLCRDGHWVKATYKDAITLPMGGPFGDTHLYPMTMPEIYRAQQQYKLRNVSVYVSGFNWFVDYVVIPMIYLTQRIRRGFAASWMCRLFAWGVNHFSPPYSGVAMVNDAAGIKDGKLRRLHIAATLEDAYLFTAIPIVACVRQYLHGSLPSGLWRMGEVVHEESLMADLRALGINVTITEAA